MQFTARAGQQEGVSLEDFPSNRVVDCPLSSFVPVPPSQKDLLEAVVSSCPALPVSDPSVGLVPSAVVDLHDVDVRVSALSATMEPDVFDAPLDLPAVTPTPSSEPVSSLGSAHALVSKEFGSQAIIAPCESRVSRVSGPFRPSTAVTLAVPLPTPPSAALSDPAFSDGSLSRVRRPGRAKRSRAPSMTVPGRPAKALRGVLEPPVSGGFHVFQEAWDSFGEPKHFSTFVGGPVDVGDKPVPVTKSTRWPALLDQLWAETSAASLESAGTSVTQWQEFLSELSDAGASVPGMTSHACRMAAAFREDPDGDFLVRGAACGVGFPFSQVPEDTFYTVENYVSDEQWPAMQAEILKERSAGNIVPVLPHWKVQGVSAVGIVEKERKGVVKFRPVWDYSRPEDVGVNSRIDLVKERFSSVKDAYSLLRPGLWMAKVDLTAAYRSVPVAARYWMAHVFEWDGVVLADTRAPFGNSAMPGVFTRFTRAIVRWMQSQGASIVGYLDDFFLVGSFEEVQEFMWLLHEFVVFLGFEVNADKCEGPGQCLEFLGIELSTADEVCTASISGDRMLVVQAKVDEIRRLGSLGGAQVPRTKLEGLLGLLAFCGQVVHGLSLYTRFSHALLTQCKARFLHLSDKVVQDLKVICTVIRLYNGRKVRLDRLEVKWEWFSTDASTGIGMGAVLDKRWFAVTWDWLKSQPQEVFFPFRPGCPQSSDIGYLELFTLYWALVLWGKYIEGKSVVVHIDNTCVIGQLEKWWGPSEYIPLLRQIFFLCVQHDIRLLPTYITSKDNVYSDLLSRGQVAEFKRRFREDRQVSAWIEDRDDWMLLPNLWAPLDVQFGPFSVDCCVSRHGANSFCRVGWTKEDDARVMDFRGHNAWGNLPFSDFLAILQNFLRCKRRQQRGTSGTFLVPCWEGNPGYELVKSLPEVFKVKRRWKARSTMFTAPSPEGGGRTFWGKTRFEVMVVHCPPGPVVWTDSELTGVTW